MKFKHNNAPLILALVSLVTSSCSFGRSDVTQGNSVELSSLAIQHTKSFTFKQSMDELLLAFHNDTSKVCYCLVMPYQTFVRLTECETYPLDFTRTKVNEVLVGYFVNGTTYLDSLTDANKPSEDWIMNKSSNEPIDPIWEKITEDYNE